jgi:dsDNA-specific endonuclease/ATPase MutS2
MMANNVTVVNQGNKLTFITAVRKDVLDVTITTQNIRTLIKKWKVFNRPSISDHQNIDFEINSAIKEDRTFRDSKSTNWAQYSEDLIKILSSMNSKIKDEYNVETAAETLQEAVITTYHNNCPLKTRKIIHQTS